MGIPEEKVAEVAADIARECGLTLVDVELNSGSIRVILDRGGKLSTEDCERASRELDQRLEAIDPSIRSGMPLEVSSPGMRRVLKSPREFDVFRDRALRITVAHEGRFETFVATSRGLLGDSVRLAADGKEFSVPLAEVRKARLHSEDRWEGLRSTESRRTGS